MIILALDLGTQMGWAVSRADGSIHGGSKGFQPAKYGGHGGKFIAFMTHLNQVKIDHGPVNIVYYEHIKRHEGVLAAHAYGGYLAILQVWCKLNGVAMHQMDVGAIKKFWTGKGNANKEMMIAAAKQRGFAPDDDNHADALAILGMACGERGRAFPGVVNKPEGALL